MRLHHWILAVAAVLALGCTAGGPAVEDGVSLELAEYRAARVSDLRYDIEFIIPEQREEPVTGRETISFTLKKRAPLQLDFRQDAEAVNSLRINGQDGDAVWGLRINGRDCAADCRNEHIILDASLLRKGSNTVELAFIAGDRSLNRNDEYLYTLFVPDRARTVFPCFDQPDLKGRFSLTLDLPAEWEAVANSARQQEAIANETEPQKASAHGTEQQASVAQSVKEPKATATPRKRLTFRETPPLSTYLFAFTAGKWHRQSATRGQRTVSALYRETDPDKLAQLRDIFDQVFQSLDWLEAYTGIPCPFEKYDFVIVPGFQFGGMEHPGAILYNERTIFLGPAPTTAERLSRAELIAHETAHLWFGDAVTMRWFNDVWTKEVFANFYASQISTPMFPDVNVPLRDFRAFTIPAYAEDRTAGTNAIRRPLPNLSSAGLIYGNIVYDKAPVVMRMLSDLLGEEAFRDGIREYLHRYLYANADWNDLIAVLDARTEIDLQAWSRVWVEEKGMPTITYAVTGDTLTVRQEDPLGRGLIWPQRLTFADAAGRTVASIWSDSPETKAQLADIQGELIPNPDAKAYGWFRLDAPAADALLQALPGLPRPESRLSLLATLHENVLRGTIPPHTYVERLGECLRTESDPLVCASAAAYLKALAVHGPVAGSPRLERELLEAAEDPALSKEIRLQALRSLAGVFRSDAALKLIRALFQAGTDYQGLKLGQRDFLTLAYELAIRCPEDYDTIRALQEQRLKNPDQLREFRFIYPSVAPEKARRDSVFRALLEPRNRAVEPWAAAALGYLNHPLRQQEALEYIRPALEALPEIQRTGDIFFPKNWCVSLLGGHDSPQAANEVLRFLDAHPDFPDLLKTKLLQSADHLLNVPAK